MPREYTKASGVIVVVFNGTFGNGFSVQAVPEIVASVPAILRELANEIDRSFGQT
jgi:hypothetical protein